MYVFAQIAKQNFIFSRQEQNVLIKHCVSKRIYAEKETPACSTNNNSFKTKTQHYCVIYLLSTNKELMKFLVFKNGVFE